MGIEISPDHGGAGSSFSRLPSLSSRSLPKSTPPSRLCVTSTTPSSTPLSANTVPKNNKTSGCHYLPSPQYVFTNHVSVFSPSIFSYQLSSFCLSEPASGSDAFALQTRAKKEGDHWILNGSKMWITNSYEADIFLIFANASALIYTPLIGILMFSRKD